jgi:hypothetical protein
MNSREIAEINGGFIGNIIWVVFQQAMVDYRKVVGIIYRRDIMGK